MAAAAPPPLPSTAAPPHIARRRHLLSVDAKDLHHSLKLRTNFVVSKHARLEVGADVALDTAPAGARCSPAFSSLVGPAGIDGGITSVHSFTPCACLCYQLDPDDRSRGCLKVEGSRVCLSRRVQLGRAGARWDAPLDLCVGLKLHKGGMHPLWSVSPVKWQHQVAVAVALLATGMPVHLHRTELGNWGLQVPIYCGGGSRQTHVLQERAEVEARLQRQGRRLQLELRQLNAVIRLREV